jgi:hypothetical protein
MPLWRGKVRDALDYLQRHQRYDPLRCLWRGDLLLVIAQAANTLGASDESAVARREAEQILRNAHHRSCRHSLRNEATRSRALSLAHGVSRRIPEQACQQSVCTNSLRESAACSRLGFLDMTFG